MSLEGQVLGDFRLLHELGRGGMGIVYLAEQLSLGRRVAVKILPRTSSLNPEILARFRREAEAASRLDHPAICAVYATGTHDDIPYIVMRHVEGLPLSRVIQERRRSSIQSSGGPSSNTFRFDFNAESQSSKSAALPAHIGSLEVAEVDSDAVPVLEEPTSTTREDISWAVQLVERAARALHVAHDARIIHRDIKPGNIMVQPDGSPVLLDFGLARHLEEKDGASLTQSGDLMGTPHYMSPEQLSGQGTVDARTDVYSLGVTLYELIAGRRPFDAPNRERLYRSILHEDAPSARRLNPAIERDLEVVVHTAIERDLNRRYQSAFAFAEDLKAVLHHEPIAARSLGPVIQARKWVRRHPAVSVMLVSIFVILTGGLIEAWAQNRRIERERDQKNDALKSRDQAVSELEGALRAARAMRLAALAQAAAANEPALAVNLALEAARIEPSAEADRSLRIALSAAPELRTYPAPNFFSLSDAADRTPARLRGLRRPPANAARGLNPNRVLRAKDELSADRARHVLAVRGDIHWPTNRVVTMAGSDGGVPIVYDLVSGQVIAVLAAHHGVVNSARFSTDGERIVTAGEDGTIRIHEVATGRMLLPVIEPKRTIFDRLPAVEEASFAAGDRFLLAVIGNRALLLNQQGNILAEKNHRVDNGPPLAVFHPRRPYAASALTDRVIVWLPTAREVALDDAESEHMVLCLAFSPTDPWIAVGDASGRINLWELPENLAGPGAVAKRLTTIIGHDGEVRSLAFSSNGRLLATGSADTRVNVYAVDGNGQLQRRHGPFAHDGSVLHLSFNDNGELLASGCTDHVARVFDLKTPATVREFRGHEDWVTRVTLSPDRTRLVTATFGGVVRVLPLDDPGVDPPTSPHPSVITAVEWSQDGAVLATLSRDGLVRLLGADGRVIERRLDSDSQARALRFSKDGKRLLVLRMGSDCVDVLDANDLSSLSTLSDPGSGPTKRLASETSRASMALFADGQSILTLTPSGLPVLLDASGKVLELFKKYQAAHTAIASHPDQNLALLWASTRPPTFFTPPNTWRAIEKIHGRPRGVGFAPDGRLAWLLSAEGSLTVVRTADQSIAWQHFGVVTAPAFLNYSPWVAVADRSGPVHLLNVADGREVGTIPILGADVGTLLARAEPESILSFSDGVLRVFDPKQRTFLIDIRVGATDLRDLHISPDGRRVALGFSDGSVRRIHLDPASIATHRAVRALTSTEMERADIGTIAERDARRAAEDEEQRRIEVLAHRSRVLADPENWEDIVAYANRVLTDETMPKEELETVRRLLERISTTGRAMGAEALQLLALAHDRCNDPAKACSAAEAALKLLPLADPERAELEDLLKALREASRESISASPSSVGDAHSER